MDKTKQLEPTFTSKELNSIIDRIMIQVSKIVELEIHAKTVALNDARTTARRILKMDQHDWMKIQDAANLFGVSIEEIISKIHRLQVPFIDSYGFVHAPFAPFRQATLTKVEAIGKQTLLMMAQSFDSEKGRALREYTALSMLNTMQGFAKI